MNRNTRKKIIAANEAIKIEGVPALIIASNKDKTFLVVQGSAEHISKLFQAAFAEDPDLWRTIKHATDKFSEIPKEDILLKVE